MLFPKMWSLIVHSHNTYLLQNVNLQKISKKKVKSQKQLRYANEHLWAFFNEYEIHLDKHQVELGNYVFQIDK